MHSMALTDPSNMGLERFASYRNATNQNIERADQPDSTSDMRTYTLVYSHRPWHGGQHVNGSRGATYQ